MTNQTNSIACLQIIIGESFFTPGNTVVGMAIKGQTDSVGCTKWAETIKGRGRPASVNPLNSYKSEAQAIADLRAKWLEWAEDCGITITIVDAVRRDVGKF